MYKRTHMGVSTAVHQLANTVYSILCDVFQADTFVWRSIQQSILLSEEHHSQSYHA